MIKKQYVIARGQVFRAEDKAPFTASGKSFIGVLEYRPDTDEVRFGGISAIRQPRRRGVKYTEDALRDLLIDFHALNHRLPVHEWGKGQLPSKPCYERMYGTMAKAYEAAGLLLVAKRDPRRLIDHRKNRVAV